MIHLSLRPFCTFLKDCPRQGSRESKDLESKGSLKSERGLKLRALNKGYFFFMMSSLGVPKWEFTISLYMFQNTDMCEEMLDTPK